jgi:hypothetical protein
VGERNLFGDLFVLVNRNVFLFCSPLHFEASQFFDNIIYDIETLVRSELKFDIAKVLKVQMIGQLLFALTLKSGKHCSCLFPS